MNLGAALVIAALALKFIDVAPTTAPTLETLEGRLKFGFGL